MEKRFQIGLIIIFIVMLIFPTLQSIFHFSKPELMTSENRALTPMPSLDLKDLHKFPTQFDAHYNDYFPYRKKLTRSYFKLQLKMHQSPIPSIIFGKESFLFSGNQELPLYEGTYDFCKEERRATAEELLYRYNYLKERGIKFYVYIAPTSFEVYPEMLPAHIKRTKKTDTDLFCELMQNEYPQIPFIYLKDSLLSKKEKGLLYLKNDNHWNGLGGFYGTNAVINKIRKDFSNLPHYEWEDFKGDTAHKMIGNLVESINIVNYTDCFVKDVRYENIVLNRENLQCQVLPKVGYPAPPGFAYPDSYESRHSTGCDSLPNALFIRDSYVVFQEPFFKYHFNKSLFIFDAWQYARNFDIIEKEQPDIVILEMYEPHIRNLIRHLRSEEKKTNK